MVGVYTIVKPAAENGWGASHTLLLGALSLGLLAGFLAREATARDPLIAVLWRGGLRTFEALAINETESPVDEKSSSTT